MDTGKGIAMNISSASSLRKALLVASAGAAMLPSLAWSQETDDDADGSIIVTGHAVSATKTDTPLVQIPQAISVISSQEIQDRTVVDFQDVYRYSAGVSANASVDSRGDFVVSRGFDAAQYLDGLKRMPDFIYGARLEPFTLDRAEVLRGPSSVLYGAGGPGGVIAGVSKKPEFSFGGEAGLIVGTDKRIQGQFDVTGPMSDRFAARLVVLGRNGETQWGTDDDRLLINPSIRWQPDPDTDITVIGLYQHDKGGSLGYTPLTKSRVVADKDERVKFNFYQGEPGFNGMDTQYTSIALIATHRFSDAISFRTATRYSAMDTDYKEVYLNYTASPFADAAETLYKREWYVNYENSEVLNSDSNLIIDFSTGPIEHQVLLGVDYTWFKQDKREGYSYDGYVIAGYTSPPPIDIYNPVYGATFDYGPFYDTHYRNTQLGFYAQDQMSYADRIHVVLGLRHDNATAKGEADQNQWSFRGGVIAELAYGVSPYFNYAESFVPVGGGDFYGNPYKPRVARQYEGGVKWEPMSGALLSAAYFDIVEDNYISQDPDNIQNFLQGGSVKSTGWELEATIRRPGGYDFTASYSYVDAVVHKATSTMAKGDRISGQPRHMASAWGTKTFIAGDDLSFRAGLGMRYIGNKIDAAQIFITPAVTLFDAMVSANYKDWVISVNASNVLNKKYYDICSEFASPYGYCVAAKDRTVLASLTRKF